MIERPICERTGKRIYLTHDLARARMREMMEEDRVRKLRSNSRGLNVYRCRYCRSFHIGHDFVHPVVRKVRREKMVQEED